MRQSLSFVSFLEARGGLVLLFTSRGRKNVIYSVRDRIRKFPAIFIFPILWLKSVLSVSGLGLYFEEGFLVLGFFVFWAFF